MEYPLQLLVLTLVATEVAAECENGWATYKDELCIKVFPTTFLNFDESKDFCSYQSNGVSTATLVTVKDSTIQDLLANYTHDIFDNVWLGGQYDEATSQFRWVDGEPLNYTNWQEGYPTNITDSDSCIELRPRNAKSDFRSEGKWADASCQKRNLAICQRRYPWSTEEIIAEMIKIRKLHQEDLENVNEILQATQENLLSTQQDLENTQQNLQTTQQDLQRTKQDLQTVSSKVVPVGSIYIEYYGQPSPRSLWGSLTWQDITSTYSGVFFRALGSGSASWGTTQTECAPRITQMSQLARTDDTGGQFPSLGTVPSSGWSTYGHIGGDLTDGGSGTHYWDGFRVYTEGCEVRPKNQAVRIWKRTG